MTAIHVRVFVLIALALSASSAHNAVKPKRLWASTYYIAARAAFDLGSGNIGVRGSSNLPAGAILTLYVYDYIGQGSHVLSDEARLTVHSQGFFSGEIKPLKGISFRRNLVCSIYFAASYPQQPANVILDVGRKGEHLGFPNNPQAGVSSGENHHLSALIVVE